MCFCEEGAIHSQGWLQPSVHQLTCLIFVYSIRNFTPLFWLKAKQPENEGPCLPND